MLEELESNSATSVSFKPVHSDRLDDATTAIDGRMARTNMLLQRAAINKL